MAMLNEFTALIKSTGLMRNARYSIEMPSPNTIQYGTRWANVDIKNIMLLCDQIQVPGLNYTTTANLTYGETREVPYTRMYDNINMSLYVDNNMMTKNYFDDWLFSIQNPVTRTFSYYRDYITEATINVEDLNDMTSYSVTLHECYPKSVTAIQLDYASKEVMKLNITLAYKYWTRNTYNVMDKEDKQFFNMPMPELSNTFTGVTTTSRGVLTSVLPSSQVQRNERSLGNLASSSGSGRDNNTF